MTNINDFNAHFRAIDRANNIRLINEESERLKRQKAHKYIGKADLSKYQKQSESNQYTKRGGYQFGNHQKKRQNSSTYS